MKPLMIKIKNFIKRVPSFFKARKLSTQLIITIILIFASFFILQSLLNNSFFKNYYSEREFDRIHEDLMLYIDALNEEGNDYYDETYKFTSENNAYSVLVSGQYRVLTSSFTDYTIVIKDSISDIEYTYLVPNNDYQYSIDETVLVSLYEYNDELYTPAVISNQTGIIFNSDINCNEETCFSVSGTVVEINKPNNLNYLYDDNKLVQTELSKLYNDTISLQDHEYTTGSVEGYWYKSTDGPIDTLVFIHKLESWNWIITVIPIVDTKDIINVVSSYNYYVYLTAIAIIFIWSFRLSSIISKPIQNIELVAREIAQLNFNVEAHEYNNRENESLSNSINLISRNLKDTLETINTKNTELTELYDAQSEQVTLKKQLVSSISHELKTPLMIMQVTIQGILDGIIESSDQEKELNNVIEEINKSSLMIQDMLQIYRLDDANTQLELSEFDLSKTVCFFVNDFENAIKKYDFQVDVNVQDEVYIEADLKLIKRVISNFLTNAIKYTPIGGKIYIEVSEDEDFAYFELTNYGTTISEDEISKIWLPFYRLEQENSTRLKTKGSGIGLYLVSEILKAHKAEYGIVTIEDGVKAFFKINKKTEMF